MAFIRRFLRAFKICRPMANGFMAIIKFLPDFFRRLTVLWWHPTSSAISFWVIPLNHGCAYTSFCCLNSAFMFSPQIKREGKGIWHCIYLPNLTHGITPLIRAYFWHWVISLSRFIVTRLCVFVARRNTLALILRIIAVMPWHWLSEISKGRISTLKSNYRFIWMLNDLEKKKEAGKSHQPPSQ